MIKKPENNFPGWLKLLVYFSLLYAIFFVFNLFTDESTEFITDNWEISSKSDKYIYTFFQVLSMAIIVGAAIFALRISYIVLQSKKPFLYFGLFMILLCIFGAVVFFLVVPREEMLEFIHVPIIALIFAALGGFMIYASERKIGKDKRKS